MTADLIAAISAAPDDEGAFLVYADYLQSQSDPRGELIMLMHRGDDALVKSHMKAHDFIGVLKRHEASVKLAWRLGFVDRVRLIADDEKHALQLLDLVVDHPSCCFIRRLEILILGKRRSYVGVEQRLIELARPATLKELVFGKTGDHAVSPTLAEVFPMLPRAAVKSWDDISTAIGAKRSASPDFAIADLAPITLADGRPIPLVPDALLRGLAAEVGKQPVGLFAKLREECTPAMLDTFAASLVTAWTLHGEEARLAWVYDVATAIGGAKVALVIARRISGLSHPRAVHAIDSLAKMRSPLATLELFAASKHWSSRGEHAEQVLAAIARRSHADVLTLLARTGSDPRDAYEDATLERFRELDREVVDLLMGAGWSAPLATVMDLFRRAPRHEWTSTLVWRAGNLTFVLGADGPIDHTGTPVKITGDVSLVHPADDLDVSMWLRETPQLRRAPKRVITQLTPPDRDALRARGYRNGGAKNEFYEETRYVKSYPYRGKIYTVAVEDGGVRSIPNELPPVVLYEVARDFGSSTST